MGAVRGIAFLFCLFVAGRADHDVSRVKSQNRYEQSFEKIDKVFAAKDHIDRQYDEYVAEIDGHIQMINKYHENVMTFFQSQRKPSRLLDVAIGK